MDLIPGLVIFFTHFEKKIPTHTLFSESRHLYEIKEINNVYCTTVNYFIDIVETKLSF